MLFPNIISSDLSEFFSLNVHNVYFEIGVNISFFISRWKIKTQRGNELVQGHRRGRLKNLSPQSPATTEGEHVRKKRLFMNIKYCSKQSVKFVAGLLSQNCQRLFYTTPVVDKYGFP